MSKSMAASIGITFILMLIGMWGWIIYVNERIGIESIIFFILISVLLGVVEGVTNRKNIVIEAEPVEAKDTTDENQ